MRRMALALLLAIPVLALPDSPPYLPLEEGAQWTYDARATVEAAGVRTTTEGKVTARCVGSRRVGEWEYRVIRFSGDEKTRELDGECCARLEGDSVRVSGHPLLPLERGRGKAEGYSVEEPVRVEVPFGAYDDAVRVSSEVALATERTTREVWYVRGVGAVRIVEEVRSTASVVRRELSLRVRSAGGDTPGGKEDPARPETPAAPAVSGFLLASELSVAGGTKGHKAWEALDVALGRAQERARALGGEAGSEVRRLADFPGRRILTADRLSGPLQDVVLVRVGALRLEGPLEDCIAIVLGDLDATAVQESLIIASGTVTVRGAIEDSTVLASVRLEIQGVVEDCFLQAAVLVVDGASEDCVFMVKDAAKLGLSEGCRRLIGPGPLEAFEGR
ncbi:MAG: hypothetical protein HY722_07775 [Planctomycetes bacterium]|nr:hypothetical protein [Planctomycetota bacterium]